MPSPAEGPGGAASTDTLLDVRDISAWYGEAQVLDGLSLEVRRGEIVTLVGRNGAGKTTLLRCLMGLHPQMTGEIHLAGRPVTSKAPHQRARLGMGYVPDDRGIYATLSVEENLTLAPVVGDRAWSLEQVFETFPVLKERRGQAGTHLSGGEQQMLSLARVLVTGADLLLADEPTEGLSPLLVEQIGDIFRSVREHGVTVLLIEQNLHFASTLADRHHLIADGRVVESMDNAEVMEREQELLEYLGI